MKKEPLLFLCHRIPFPPNKGDKIRSFNMLKALSRVYDIYLAAFVDDPFDWQYVDTLDNYCQQKLLLGQNKTWCKVKGLSAFVSGQAISVPYYRDAKMTAWVKQIVNQQNIQNIFVFSSAMAQYAEPHLSGSSHLVVDFVDVDSDKWRQYAEGKSGVASWVYNREYKKLQSYENKIAAKADSSLFVSPQEAGLFTRQLPEQLHDSVKGVLNGVDTDYFNPDADIDDELQEQPDVVFTGAMDYWANVDAVVWFSKHVWPGVREANPDASFYIVGGNPSNDVKALDGQNGIVVTGRVKDVRPYIQQAKVTVAPLQIARGIQNKVLEAMSMAKPVVATSMAYEGIEAELPDVVVTDEPTAYTEAVNGYLKQTETAPANRSWILENLKWEATLSVLPGLFDKD